MTKLFEKVYYRFLGLLLILLPILAICHLWVFHLTPKEFWDQLMPRTALTSFQDREYLSTIDDVQVADPYVYVLYGRKHIVKVYDTARNYVYTYIVPSKMSSASFYVHEDRLYLHSDYEFYEFADKVCVRVYCDDEKDSLFNTINSNRQQYRNNRDQEQRRYFVKAESVFREDRNGVVEPFVKRSPLYFICHPGFYGLLVILMIVVYMIPEEIRRNRKNKAGLRE